MLKALRLVVALIGLWFIAIAGAWMLMPEWMSVQFAITLEGALGYNTGRGDLGGLFLAAGILCLLGLRNHQSAAYFLYSVSIIMGTVAFGRLVGFLFDGVVLTTILPFVVELGFIAIFCTFARMLDRSQSSQ
jgi:hypothetical protein